MKPTNTLAVIGLTVGMGAYAETHLVKAVAKPSFRFEPNIVRAEVGDYIEFHFGPQNHSVARGTFSKACEPAHDEGFFSGYLPVEEGESDKVFKVLVENSDPIAFYCTQGKHCASGMFGIVNPTDKHSGEAYAALVADRGDKPAAAPHEPFGGALIDNPGADETASETAPAATGAFTTSVNEPGAGVPTAAEGAPGSIQTAEEGSGVVVGARLVGAAAAAGLALLLAYV